LGPTGAEAKGQYAPLAEYPSLVKTGLTGELIGKKMEIMGRVRYDYPDGFWDEWILTEVENPEKLWWLQEDEGDWVLFEPQGTLPNSSRTANWRVGEWAELGGNRAFVAEKNTARINGSEGQLPFQVIPGQQADFLDAMVDGWLFSVEFLPQTVELFRGRYISLKNILDFAGIAHSIKA
jgi:hypothetical protein